MKDKTWTAIKAWAWDIGWGFFLYAIFLVTLVFILAQGEADFIYAAF